MKIPRSIFFSLVGLAVSAMVFIGDVGSAEAYRSPGAKSDEAGFQSIFNGRDFIGWAGPIDEYQIVDGAIAVPTGPGLGVELDEAALDRQHRVYLDSSQRERDDAGYIRRFQPSFDPQLPRF